MAVCNVDGVVRDETARTLPSLTSCGGRRSACRRHRTLWPVPLGQGFGSALHAQLSRHRRGPYGIGQIEGLGHYLLDEAGHRRRTPMSPICRRAPAQGHSGLAWEACTLLLRGFGGWLASQGALRIQVGFSNEVQADRRAHDVGLVCQMVVIESALSADRSKDWKSFRCSRGKHAVLSGGEGFEAD